MLICDPPGFNSLEGFQILSLNISLKPAPDGSNINGVVLIPNPTPLSVAMGQVIQNVFVDGQLIGNNTFANLTLNPGNNTVTFTGISDQNAVISLISKKYTDGILPVTMIGNSSIYNGQHLPYYEAALSSLALKAELNVGAALSAIGIDIGLLTGGKGGSSSSSSASGQPTSSGQPSGTSSGTHATTTS